MNRRAFLASIAAAAIAVATEGSVSAEEMVYFNTRSRKYHCATCRALRTCTHCVEMALSKAKISGDACKLCGGSCAR